MPDKEFSLKELITGNFSQKSLNLFQRVENLIINRQAMGFRADIHEHGARILKHKR